MRFLRSIRKRVSKYLFDLLLSGISHEALFDILFSSMNPQSIEKLTHLLDSAVEPNRPIRDSIDFVVFNQVEGDYMEFGVYKGDTFQMVVNEFRRNGIRFNQMYRSEHDDDPTYTTDSVRFFAFDSFEGLPESQDPNVPEHWKGKGTYTTSLRDFMETLNKYGVELDKVEIVVGFFDETLTSQLYREKAIKRVALAYIDCDLYESAIPVLNWITELVSTGSVLVFDDWFRYKGDPRKGMQRACYDWLEKNPHIKLTELSRSSGNRIAFVVALEPTE